MVGFVLRVKSKSGQKVVDDLAPEDDITKLKTKLTEVTGVKSEALYVLHGFPPKPLDLSEGSTKLEVSGITSGDTLIIEERQHSEHNGLQIEDTPKNHTVDEKELPRGPGVLMKKVVPADNSCLFTSIGFVLNNGNVDPNCTREMRKIIANTVKNDPEEYCEAILNKPNAEYCTWILKSNSWGGAIEISILSRYYGHEIAVVDSINGIINRFGEDQHFSNRVFLIFDGIHYDPLYLEPVEGGNIRTIFSSNDEEVMTQAFEIANESKSSRQFTDLQKLALKCLDCDLKFSGQIAAQKHAHDSGHKNFNEV